MIRPFVVFGLPRSRTFWLSRFLSYGGWSCGHEQILHVRAAEDIKAWLAMPFTGTAETAAAPFWRTLQAAAPDARVVVVRRPPGAVFDAMLATGIAFDRAVLATTLQRLDAKLDQLAARWPDALSVRYADLDAQATCAAIFEHCLPFPHDPAWWEALAPLNLQTDLAPLFRYFAAHRTQLDRAAAMVRQQTLSRLAARPVVAAPGITFQAERFEPWFADAQALMRDHLVTVGEDPDNAAGKNLDAFRRMDDIGALQIMTARCNGRMFGYLMTIVSPSLEDARRTTAVHTAFYAAPSFPGLGMKLQRAALAALRERGANEVYFRAGPRGAGPKMGALYRRLGASGDGDLYRLELASVSSRNAGEA